ncbi:MAG TPA: aspartate aminotransferase family protein [Spirillospora sp.]|nr:aspartate aminotransferase family protein [Spirillospora sp.]
MTTVDLTQQVIDLEQTYVVQSYARPPFVLARGEGVTLYDTEGNAYLDFVAGIAVNALGYGDADITAAIQQALSNGVLHVSNLYHTAPHAELAALLCEKSFADRVLFCNSGAEANEGAIKFARKVAYEKGKTDKTEIVTFTNGFHGRTIGALAVTPKEKYQKPFAPLMPGAVLAEFNSIESAQAAIGPKTAGVIVEPIQGEGGINPATPEFLRALRELCDKHDAVLIFDEIQCGLGRTGTLWAHEQYGVTPDIMTLAKPLANGLPMGAVLCTEAVASAIKPGDHGSTFAGGLLVASVAKVVVERISQPEFLAHVTEVGAYLMERLAEINSPLIKEVRGRGLMAGIELTIPAVPLVKEGFRQGLLTVNAGDNVLRFVPPLIIEKKHIDAMIEKLTVILSEAANA